MDNLLFSGWDNTLRILLQTVAAYLCMIFFLRITGKRTLSKMNAFDFIVTIALGSALATMALSRNVAIVEGALAILLLIGMQYLITWLSVRLPFVKNLVTSEPRLLLYRGEILDDVLRKERITIEELRLAARNSGATSLRDIDIVILETTGVLTVIRRMDEAGQDALRDVAGKSGISS